ncbi:MAG TPA: hypothetical protein VJB06_03520 [archaeon]|nr:hypothetical protein [archaeon]
MPMVSSLLTADSTAVLIPIDFIKEFESGKLGDREEFFEWYSIAQAKEHWKEKLHMLIKASSAK